MQAIGGGIAAAYLPLAGRSVFLHLRAGLSPSKCLENAERGSCFLSRKSRKSFARALRLAQDGKTHRIEIALNLVVPESDRPEPLRFEMPVPCGIAS